MYNHARFVDAFGEESMKYEKTTQIPGFKLYNLGSYPAAVQSSNEFSIIIDLFSLSDKVYDSIKRMEHGAGYYEDLINIDDEQYSIFLFHESDITNEKLVNSGDWFRYKFLDSKTSY